MDGVGLRRREYRSNATWLAAALACLLPAWLAAPPRSLAEDWPQWRGPRGTGVSAERELPIIWHEDRGVLWKCPLPEYGTSTPCIWKGAVFVTTHAADGRLLLLRIDASKGRVVWQQEVGRAEAVRDNAGRGGQKFHRLHNLASPSPVTDGRHVAVHFGNGDLAAFDFNGERLWKRNLADDYGAYTVWWGHANSPVLYQGLVISACMHDSLADVRDKPVESYLAAHHISTGAEAWKAARNTGAPGEEADAYTTPIVLESAGESLLVVMGGNVLDAYDPASGKPAWSLPGLVGGRTVASPTAADGVIFATRGMRKPLLAVPAFGSGERSRREILWEYDHGTPDSCSPVVWGELLFTVTDEGVARCHSAQTGRLYWKERLAGDYKASPIAAAGRVYFLNTTGLCSVVSASNRFDKLTENQLQDETLASPAVSNGRLYIRGRKHLYCLGQ